LSYDLNFCKGKNSTYNWGDLSDWCLRCSPNFRKSAAAQVWYENEATGVYFSFEQQDADWVKEQAELSDLSALTDLTFNINFLRPTFFGREAMPFVTAAAKQFGLLISNPQADEIPVEADANALILNYVDHNARAAAAYLAQEDSSLTVMDSKRSAVFFRHNSQYSRLIKRYKNDYFVPRMFLCRKKSTNEILTFTTVSAAVFAILPETDMVVLTRERKRLFKKEMELMFMRYDEFRALMGQIVSDTNHPGMYVISEEQVDAAEKVINNLRFEKNEDFEGISPDRVIDFVPGGDSSGITMYEWEIPEA
jgi:hypothetical protein